MANFIYVLEENQKSKSPNTNRRQLYKIIDIVYVLTQNITLNPNITYFKQQLTSLVSLLYFRTGIVTTFRSRFTHKQTK